MDFEITTGNCSNCKGIEKCDKMCIYHTGKALVDFINRVDMIETRIGEYSSREKGGKQDLVVYGHQIFDLKSPSWLLTDINTTLDANSKFKMVYDKNAVQVVNLYGKYIGMSTEEINDITNKIKSINRNKLIILPFKPHTNCNIDVALDGVTEKKKDAEINSIKWVTDKETHKLKCLINFKINNAVGTSSVNLDIKDYISKFRLSQMELQAKGNKHDKNLIVMTDYGMFKPIVVKHKNTSVAIDGTYVYFSKNNETIIIGYWDEHDKLVITSDIKSPALTKVKDNLEYIKSHKRYMAPYLLYESNTVEV